MTLAAFTNAQGDHSRYVTLRSRQYGTYFYGHIDEIIDTQNVLYERSIKPQTMHCGVTHGCNYNRMVYKVHNDKPALKRVYSVNPQKDYVEEHYISIRHTPFSYYPGSDGGNAANKAQVSALNNLKGASSALGADLGEAHQTIDMLAKDVSAAAKALTALRHGNLPAFVAALGLSPKQLSKSPGSTIANMWLEYNYGWKPLAQSIYDTHQVLQQTIKTYHDIRSHGHATNSTNGSFNDNGQVWHWDRKQSYKTVLDARVTNATLLKFNQLGLVNPLSIAWELVPWSFAVDWFVPVGKTLEALTAGVGLMPLGGWTTCHDNFHGHITIQTGLDAGGGGYVDGGDYSESIFAFSRNCFASFPTPRFYTNPNPYSTPRALNALALVRQLV